MQFNDGYTPYKKQFLKMMGEFASMQDGHLGQIAAAEHRIDLVSPKKIPSHQSSYLPESWHRELRKTEDDRVPADDLIEPANKEWASPIVFVSQKNDSTCFLFDHVRLNLANIRASYLVRRMNECSDSS